MTITTLHTTTRYVGDGDSDTFVGSFEMLSATDVVVLVDDESVAIAEVIGNVRNASGWEVRLAAAPALNSAVLVMRRTGGQQLTNYADYGRYMATQHTKDFDRAICLIQELQYELTKTAQITDSELADGVDPDLPPPLANQLIGWGSAGLSLENYNAADLATVAAYSERIIKGFDGVAGQTQFLLDVQPANLGDTAFLVRGVQYEPGVDFELSGLTITLAQPLVEDTRCFAVYGRAIVSGATGLTGSKTHAFDGTDGATTTLTITGAAVGDDVLVTMPYAIADVVVRGYVSAADTVTLVKTGAGNPGSATYPVRVFSQSLE